MNSLVFLNGFRFREFDLQKYHYTDNRRGSPQHYIAYMKKGRARIVGEERTVEITEGDVFYIPKGLSYRSYWYGEDEISFYSYGFDHFPEAAAKSYVLQVIPCGDEQKARVREIPRNRQVTDSGALGLFYSTLALLLPLMQAGATNSREVLFRKIRDIIFEDPRALTGEIARLCGVSETTVYSVCKDVSGKTPGAIRQECLVQKATGLLTSTGMSVQRISDALGFSSTSYFRKTVRAQTGKTPRQIRKEAALL